MSAHCHSCGAPIVWALTEKGKRMPLDADAGATEGVRYRVVDGDAIRCVDNEPGHISHFATCPNSAQHRKTR